MGRRWNLAEGNSIAGVTGWDIVGRTVIGGQRVMSKSHRRGARLALHLALTCGLMIAGPTSCQNGGTIFSSGADASDACGREHAAFADSKSFYLQQVAQGALLGTLG